MINAITTKRLPINAAGASLNSEVHRTIVMEAVELTPDTIKVAPVSPKDLAKANTAPEKIPGMTSGNNMFRKVVSGFAPRVREAISNVVSVA